VLAVAAVAVCNAAAEGEVQALESGESGDGTWHRDGQRMKLAHIAKAWGTVATVRKRTTHRSFNILGFFGCCYHCKHDPACTETCMHRHHIQNGFESSDSPVEREAMTHESLMQTAHAVSFIQEAAGDDLNSKSEPIALHLDAGSGKYHAAPERPVLSKDSNGVPAKASKLLTKDSSQDNEFSTSEFFHCAFSCHHKINCEESCIKRHHLSDKLTIKKAEGNSQDHYMVRK